MSDHQELLPPESIPHEDEGDRRIALAPRLQPLHRGVNAGAVSIEMERAVAEAKGKIAIAKSFPRSETEATALFLESCKDPSFAAEAFYTVPNRGHGPSIRFAEEAARCYGNFEYGHRELSRDAGKSEIEVYAWDVQRNMFSRRQITVMHIQDTRSGPKPISDQTDIDNRIANVAARQMRGRILALLPKGMLAQGESAAEATVAGVKAGTAEKPLKERIATMIGVFARIGVNNKQLVAYLKHPLDDTTVEELADMVGIRNAIKEGAKITDYFPEETKADALNKIAAGDSQEKGKDAPKAQTGKEAAAAKPPVKANTPSAPKATTKPQTPAPAPQPEPPAPSAEEEEGDIF